MGPGHVSHRRTSALYDHFDHSFIVFKNVQLSFEWRQNTSYACQKRTFFSRAHMCRNASSTHMRWPKNVWSVCLCASIRSHPFVSCVHFLVFQIHSLRFLPHQPSLLQAGMSANTWADPRGGLLFGRMAEQGLPQRLWAQEPHRSQQWAHADRHLLEKEQLQHWRQWPRHHSCCIWDRGDLGSGTVDFTTVHSGARSEC